MVYYDLLSGESRKPNVPRVAIVYHFFAHYRAAVLKTLLSDPEHHYVLVGDIRDPAAGAGDAIETWDVLPDGVPAGRMIVTPCRLLMGRFLWQRGIVGMAWRRQFDTFIFLGNAGFISTWLAAAIARLRGARVLMWTHGWTRPEKGPKRWVRNSFYRLAHGLLLYGNIARRLGLDHGFPAERLHVIYNSLDYPAQARLRQSLSAAEIAQVRATFPERSHPLLVSIGRLNPQKRLDLLIEAMGLLARESFPVNLLMIGEGTQRTELESLANQQQASTRFLGALYDEATLARYLCAADLAVIPGNVGLTAIHAMGYGIPVLSNDQAWNQMPEWEAIVPGVTGDHFPAGDAAGLARAIRLWVEMHPQRDATRRACISVIEQYWNPATQCDLINRAVDGLPPLLPPAPPDISKAGAW